MSVSCDFSTQPRRRGAERVEQALLGLATSLALAGAFSAWWAWADLRRVEASVDRVRQGLEAERERMRAIEPSRGRLVDTLVSQVLLSQEAPPQRLVAELAELLPADVRLDDLQLRYRDRLELSLRVRARKPEAYDRFLARLLASPSFCDVEPGEESRAGELAATLRFAYREGSAP